MPHATIYSDLLDGLGIGFAEYDAELCAVSWNDAFLNLFPEHREKIHVGEHYARNLARFYAVRLRGDDLREIDRLVAEGIQRHLAQASPFQFTHHGRLIKVNSAPLPSGGRVRIWKPMEGRRAAAAANSPAFDAFEKISEGACILDAENRILVANARFRELYGIADGDVVVGQTFDEVVGRSWGARPAAEMRATIRNGLRYDDAPFEIELPGDRWRRVVTRHADSDHAYLVHSDVTASRRKERELTRLATVDPLTALANRRGLDEYLAKARSPVTFIVIDVDHFKKLNDEYGHAIGDACLKRIAGILQSRADQIGGLAARLGGEEFAVVLSARDDQQALEICEGIRSLIAESGSPSLTVSIGVATGNRRYAHEWADQALYRAKGSGRNRCWQFECRQSA